MTDRTEPARPRAVVRLPQAIGHLAPLWWPWSCALAAAVAALAVWALHPVSVLALGIDTRGWAFLLMVAAGVFALAAVAGLAHAATRGRRGLGAVALRYSAALLVVSACIIGAPVAVVFGAVALRDQYQDVGQVDGHDVTVQFDPGWDEDGSVDAGCRDGVRLHLGARADPAVLKNAAPIDRWHFHVTTSSARITVDFREGLTTGSLVFPRSFCH